jgi:hypothetical protein
MPITKEGDTPDREADPQATIGRAQQRPNIGGWQRIIQLLWIADELHAIEAGEPRWRSEPKHAIRGLSKRIHSCRGTLQLGETPVIQLLEARTAILRAGARKGQERREPYDHVLQAMHPNKLDLCRCQLSIGPDFVESSL